MLNIEKYGEQLNATNGDYCDFMEKVVKIPGFCSGSCQRCRAMLFEWLGKEYKAPQIDWSKVPVDTPVIVREKSGLERKRHFSKYEKYYNEPFFCFNDGKTSFTGNNTTQWDNCRLAREEDIEKYSI